MAEPLDTTLACAFCGKTFALTEEHNCQIRELVNDLRIDRDAVRAELAAANSRIAELERRYGNAFSMFQSAQTEVAALSARLERVRAILANWPANPQTDLRAALDGEQHDQPDP